MNEVEKECDDGATQENGVASPPAAEERNASSNAWNLTNDSMHAMKSAHDAHTAAGAAYAADSPHQSVHTRQAEAHGNMADAMKASWGK